MSFRRSKILRSGLMATTRQSVGISDIFSLGYKVSALKFLYNAYVII